MYEQGNGFNDNFSHHIMWSVKIWDVLGWPWRWLLFLVAEMWASLVKWGIFLERSTEKKNSYFISWKCFIVFYLQVYQYDVLLKILSHKPDSFCLAYTQSRSEMSFSHFWFNLKSSKGWQHFRTFKWLIESLAILSKEWVVGKKPKRMLWKMNKNWISPRWIFWTLLSPCCLLDSFFCPWLLCW